MSDKVIDKNRGRAGVRVRDVQLGVGTVPIAYRLRLNDMGVSLTAKMLLRIRYGYCLSTHARLFMRLRVCLTPG